MMSDQVSFSGATIQVSGWVVLLVGILLAALGIVSFMHGGFLILLYAIPFLVAGIVLVGFVVRLGMIVGLMVALSITAWFSATAFGLAVAPATLLLFAQGRQAASGGLAVIQDSGGERELVIDLAAQHKVSFAKIGAPTVARLRERLEFGLEPVNPLDAWGTGKDFVDIFSDFPAVESPSHTFIHGPRGSGKSMMFRMMRADLPCARLHA